MVHIDSIINIYVREEDTEPFAAIRDIAIKAVKVNINSMEFIKFTIPCKMGFHRKELVQLNNRTFEIPTGIYKKFVSDNLIIAKIGRKHYMTIFRDSFNIGIFRDRFVGKLRTILNEIDTKKYEHISGSRIYHILMYTFVGIDYNMSSNHSSVHIVGDTDFIVFRTDDSNLVWKAELTEKPDLVYMAENGNEVLIRYAELSQMVTDVIFDPRSKRNFNAIIADTILTRVANREYETKSIYDGLANNHKSARNREVALISSPI